MLVAWLVTINVWPDKLSALAEQLKSAAAAATPRQENY